jgi:hypothetical protein
VGVSSADRRLTRYAAYSLLHLVVVITLVAGVLPAGWAGAVLLAVSVPLLWAWGLFQADVAANPDLDEEGRMRWRILLWCVPWSMSVYWMQHVRPEKAL